MTLTPDQTDRSTDNVSWKEYVDAIFSEHREQVQSALAAHDGRVISTEKSAAEKVEALRRETLTMLDPGHGGVSLREHMETVLTGHQRAQDSSERERARMAETFNAGLERLIAAGDQALRDHVLQQSQSTDAALTSVDRRMTAQHEEMVLRDSSLRDALVAEAKSNDVRVREAFAASEKAISKAEAAADKRFDSHNGFEKRLADQASTFMPREVVETQVDELRKSLAAVHTRLDLVQGARQGAVELKSEGRASTGVFIGAISAAVAVIGLIVVLANVLVT